MDGMGQCLARKKNEDSHNIFFQTKKYYRSFFVHFSLTEKQGFKFIDKTSMISLIVQHGATRKINDQYKTLAEAVLTSTHNLCFEQKYEK